MFHYSGYQVDNLGNNPSEPQTLLDNEIPFNIFLNLIEVKQYPAAAALWQSNQKLRHYLLGQPIQLSDYSLSSIHDKNLEKAVNLLIDHYMLEIVFYLSTSPTVEVFLKDKLSQGRSQNLLYQILHTKTPKEKFKLYLDRGLHTPECMKSTLIKAMTQTVLKTKPHLVETLNEYYQQILNSSQNNIIFGDYNYPYIPSNYAANFSAEIFSNSVPTIQPEAEARSVIIDLSADKPAFTTSESADPSKKRKRTAERVFAPYIDLSSERDNESAFTPSRLVDLSKETARQAPSTTTKMLTHLTSKTNEHSATSTKRKTRREKPTVTISNQTEPTAIPNLEKAVLEKFQENFNVKYHYKKTNLSTAAKKLWKKTPALKDWYRGEVVSIDGVESQLPVDQNIYSLFDLFYLDLFDVIAIILDNNKELYEALNSSYPNYLLQLLKKSADKDPPLCCQLINLSTEPVLIKFQPFLPPVTNNTELHDAYALQLLKLSIDDTNLCLERIGATKELSILHQFQEFLLESYPDRDLLCTALFNHIAYLMSDSSSNFSDISDSAITMGMA